jgi:hypothetical protein
MRILSGGRREMDGGIGDQGCNQDVWRVTEAEDAISVIPTLVTQHIPYLDAYLSRDILCIYM